MARSVGRYRVVTYEIIRRWSLWWGVNIGPVADIRAESEVGGRQLCRTFERPSTG